MSGTSRGRRREDHEQHEEHVNHEAWVIPYADMLTLLMALFLVMFAVGRVDAEKFEAVSESLRANFGGTGQIAPFGAGPGILDGPGIGGSGIGGSGIDAVRTGAAVAGVSATGGSHAVTASGPPSDAELALAMQREAYATAEAAYADLAEVRELVQEHADAGGLGHAVDFRVESRGLVVTIVTDQVLFADGRADVQETGIEVLDIVTAALRDTENLIAVEGHTDARPISTARFPSNWELSTARATSVLRHLVDRSGFDPARISAAGYADTRPIATNATPEGKAKNRRVEIVVLSSAPLDPLLTG